MRRKRSFFEDDFFTGFPDFSEFDKMFEEMFKDAKRMHAEPGKPLVYGFSFNVGPDGKPNFQQFGNVNVPRGKVEKSREPLVDVINNKADVTVIAELPGVDKEHLDLKADKATLTISVTDPERQYYKQVRLPAEVDPESAKAKIKNGILEVVLTKLKPSKPEEKTLKVE